MAEDQTSSGSSGDTNELLREMMKQVTRLNEKVDIIEKRSTDPTGSRGDSEEETEEDSGGLVQLTEATKTFIKAAFSGTLSNADRKKRVDKVGVPDCDQICCPKLDGVLKAVLTKEDGYLSRLHQLWLDAVAPLTAALESAEEGDLTPEKAVRAAQTALYLMGNAHQQKAQERCKKMILKLNPSLKFMAEEQKNFNTAAPMLFEEEFTKQVTATVEQVKAIKKLNIPEEKKGLFSFRVPPPKLSSRLQGWLQERQVTEPSEV